MNASFYKSRRLLCLQIVAASMLLSVGQSSAENNPPQDPTAAKNEALDSVPQSKTATAQDKTAVSNAKVEEPKSEAEKEEAARQAEIERARRASARAKGEISFDDLKFDIEKDGDFDRSMLTKDIESLNKNTIRIRGYILPQSVFKSRGFDEFVLVRDNQECCFGPGAALYDCIMIRMEKGKTADFVTRPVAVKGKFEIKEFKYPDGEKHYAIYQLTATEVK